MTLRSKTPRRNTANARSAASGRRGSKLSTWERVKITVFAGTATIIGACGGEEVPSSTADTGSDAGVGLGNAADVTRPDLGPKAEPDSGTKTEPDAAVPCVLSPGYEWEDCEVREATRVKCDLAIGQPMKFTGTPIHFFILEGIVQKDGVKYAQVSIRDRSDYAAAEEAGEPCPKPHVIVGVPNEQTETVRVGAKTYEVEVHGITALTHATVEVREVQPDGGS